MARVVTLEVICDTAHSDVSIVRKWDHGCSRDGHFWCSGIDIAYAEFKVNTDQHGDEQDTAEKSTNQFCDVTDTHERDAAHKDHHGDKEGHLDVSQARHCLGDVCLTAWNAHQNNCHGVVDHKEPDHRADKPLNDKLGEINKLGREEARHENDKDKEKNDEFDDETK